MIRLAAVLSLALLLGAANTAPASAQNIPGGSYQGSCTHIRSNGNSISANCTAPNGQRFTSSTSTNCRGDIANVNGRLTCNGGRGGGGRHRGRGNGGGYGLPGGSYSSSCSNARMSGQMLYATCPAPGGQRIQTSLNTQYCRRGADIANRNGYLNCER